MVGQNIGKYRVLDRVGRGGMGTVYRAIDETLHREVAIKVLNAELNDPEVARRFRGEAITVARLSHPGIATIYELFQHDGQWLMVMEFLRGETLEHVVASGGPLPPDRAAQLCMQSLTALAHAHSMAVVHRDLKPANIMLTHGGDIKIMDFGIARVTGTEHLTNVGFMMGTPAYMAPEQVMGQEIDARADLYAIGVVLYRLVTGQLPFKGESPFAMAQAQVNAMPTPASQFRTDLPPWVEEVLARSLAKKPDERYQSASEFHDSLERALTGAPTPSTYRSSAPAGLVSTPPRAMPTHQLARDQAASGAVPLADLGSSAPATRESFDPSGMAPTMMTPATMERPRTVELPSEVPPPAPPAPPARPAPSAPSAPSASRANSRTVGYIAAAAALVVVLGGGAWWIIASRNPTLAPVAEAPALPAPLLPELLTEAPPAPPPPADEIVPAPLAPAGGAAALIPDATPSTLPDGRAGTGRAAAPPPPVAAPVDTTPPESIPNVRVMVINGRQANDEGVVLNFADGQITAVRNGAALASMPYANVTIATYVHARNPRWDGSLASPPGNLDVGGVFRAARHWLTLQNAESFMILRLEDVNVIRAIRVLEHRTGITVRRPTN